MEQVEEIIKSSEKSKHSGTIEANIEVVLHGYCGSGVFKFSKLVELAPSNGKIVVGDIDVFVGIIISNECRLELQDKSLASVLQVRFESEEFIRDGLRRMSLKRVTFEISMNIVLDSLGIIASTSAS
ncbi:Uncharacterized protein Fot_04320 [Forsythia ovata]|uniref:Uncharacterized protein n=1 Tax=Forsythia ovata TaxID=205694 RepID=A0ABD1XCU1_9LAMI